MSKVVCAIQPCRALERSEREMRLERGKRGAEEKKAVAKQPSHPGSAAAPPREVPTVCAPPLRTHVTHDDDDQRTVGPLDKTSPPAIVGLRCAQPGVLADSPKHESGWQAPSSDMPRRPLSGSRIITADGLQLGFGERPSGPLAKTSLQSIVTRRFAPLPGFSPCSANVPGSPAPERSRDKHLGRFWAT